MPHSKEASLADQQSISFTAAVHRTFDRREAFALARPYSALIVGSGTSFVYRDGLLCYLDGRCIRILDLHQASDVERVIDLDIIGQYIWKRPRRCVHVELLHCQDGVLSFLYYTQSTDEQQLSENETVWLIAVNVLPNIPPSQRPRLAITMQNSKFWVRNDSRFLYVGSHDGIGRSHGRHEWVLQGYNLANGQPTPSLQLPNLFGTDLRQNIVFEIYDGYLYALSNQSSFEVEEIDWTSYYHCYRFALDDPSKDRLERTDIWRRQHRDGPINDSWTDLGLYKDEETGQLRIAECRREWKDGLSVQKRTFYSEPLVFPDQSQDMAVDSTPSPIAASEAEDPPASPPPLRYPFNQQLYRARGEENKTLYSDPVPRIPRNFQPEYSAPNPPTKTFLLAKTKHRTSVPASKAYLDIVQDNYTRSPSRHWQQQIYLRIGSRSQSSPRDPETGYLYPRTLDETQTPIPGSEERFHDRGIWLWPPSDAPVELLDLLNPAVAPGSQSRLIGDVAAVTDERSVVYMPGSQGRSDGASRNIVLVNFDPAIRFSGLTPLRTSHVAIEQRSEVVLSSGKNFQSREREQDAEVRATGQDQGQTQTQTQTQAPGRQSPLGKGNWWRQERARHLDIGRGFRFVY